MGLAERLAVTPRLDRRKCSIGRLLDSLPENESGALQQAIDQIRQVDPNRRKSRQEPYTATWLAGVLADEGYEIARQTVNRHVLRECHCGS